MARLVTKDTAVGDYSCRDLYHYNIIVWAWGGEGGTLSSLGTLHDSPADRRLFY